MTPTSIAAYLALFAGIGFLFLFVNLLVGKFVRPDLPNTEKLEIYECGEPTIGSSFVQFDLRFYVVALLFIIFDVEIAFFFPWATVFGKANQLRDLGDENRAVAAADIRAGFSPGAKLSQAEVEGRRAAAYGQIVSERFGELGLTDPTLSRVMNDVPANATSQIGSLPATVRKLGDQMVLVAMADIGLFFAILMVGFFYVWKRGDLDWVRAVSRERAAQVRRIPPGAPAEPEPALAP
jgi:NADH-quinone oxidoreductase subunit A